MEIQHLTNEQIDKHRWDQAVLHTSGSTFYGQSWYLDAVCPGWEALITPDYTRVMPLTARRKYGLSYLYQPLLTQQLGIFSLKRIKADEVDDFFQAIPLSFKLIEITLNEQSQPGPQYPVKEHTTLRLNLNHPYDHLYSGFSENTRRNITKATKEGLRFRTNININEFIELLKQDNSAGAKILTARKNQLALHRLASSMLNRNAGMICGVKNRHGNLEAAALMGHDKSYHYYLAPTMTAQGRESRAMFYLIDRYIHLHASLPVTLDFEGSDIPSVARFYKGFGALPGSYTSLRINRLPWPLNHWANRRIK